LLPDQLEVIMNIFKIIIDFIRSLFMHKPPKPQPFRGTAKLTWIKQKKEDNKESENKS
jgi:hypothetical protein